MVSLPEPWMRGPIPGVSPLTAPVLYSFEQAREELARYTERLTTEQLWATPFGMGPAGFHILHIAGSTDRLMTYLRGGELTAGQLEALEREKDPPRLSREELLALVDRAFAAAERVVREIDPATLAEPRAVGRKRLPTTVIGLLTHIAEHTQRHVGQAISAAKLAEKA
ncbi:MAG: DinB family protein [Acidobacteria bacterium]|nr:DinB family protein [Acidobacteriota bacterium]